MRTGSHRLAGTLVALGFVAGWFSASWLSPPTAATQVASPRPATAPAEVALPRIALEAVTAPETTPATARNPFVFSARHAASPPPPGETAPSARAAAALESAAALPPVAAAPAWRVFGIAADADGHHTAVVSGGGEVFLLALGDQLPDGSTVEAIDATGIVLARVDGGRLALRLP